MSSKSNPCSLAEEFKNKHAKEIDSFPFTAVGAAYVEGFKAALASSEVHELESQLCAIIEINKRDLTNLKYDNYFSKESLQAFRKLESEMGICPICKGKDPDCSHEEIEEFMEEAKPPSSQSPRVYKVDQCGETYECVEKSYANQLEDKIARLQSEARLHDTIVTQLQRGQKASDEIKDVNYISAVKGRQDFRDALEALQRELEVQKEWSAIRHKGLEETLEIQREKSKAKVAELEQLYRAKGDQVFRFCERLEHLEAALKEIVSLEEHACKTKQMNAQVYNVAFKALRPTVSREKE